MGEDWLLALQEELIKPYFTSVCPGLPIVRRTVRLLI